MRTRRIIDGVIGTLLLLLISNVIYAQENWQLGLEITPSYYMLLNSSDKNAFYYTTQQPELFNVKGFSGGVRFSVDFGEYFGVTSGIRYSSGRQDYVPSANWSVFDFKQYTVQRYIQLPILISFGTSNSYDRRFYVSAGLTFGYLLNYVERVEFINMVNNEFTLNEYQNETYTTISNISNYEKLTLTSDYQYNMFQVNGLIEFGFKWNFNHGLVLSLAMQGQYGITNPENRRAELINVPADINPYVLWNNNLGEKWYNYSDDVVARNRTHVLHVGLSIGIYYQFGYR